MRPEWLKDKDSWVLSDTFVQGPCKIPHPKVGDRVNDWQIIGAWVNKNRFLKAYRVQCACGTIVEYTDIGSLKFGGSKRCLRCAGHQTYDSTSYFNETYGQVRGEILRRLYKKRFELPRNGGPGPKFHEPWKTDYKAFAEYLVALPNFDKWPEYSLDRYPISDGVYEPGNVRFATTDEQLENRDITRYIEFNGVEISLTKFTRLVLGPGYLKTKVRTFIRRQYDQGISADEIIEALAKNHGVWETEATMHNFFSWYFSSYKRNNS